MPPPPSLPSGFCILFILKNIQKSNSRERFLLLDEQLLMTDIRGHVPQRGPLLRAWFWFRYWCLLIFWSGSYIMPHWFLWSFFPLEIRNSFFIFFWIFLSQFLLMFLLMCFSFHVVFLYCTFLQKHFVCQGKM